MDEILNENAIIAQQDLFSLIIGPKVLELSRTDAIECEWMQITDRVHFYHGIFWSEHKLSQLNLALTKLFTTTWRRFVSNEII